MLKSLYPQHIETTLLEIKHRYFRDILGHTLRAPSKLFRLQLIELIAQDLTKSISETTNINLLHFATAIELHHSYTLIHDDLPDMDNDDERRGRPSSHKAFGNANAILAGDALLNLSFQELTKINHPKLIWLIQAFSELTGANGLILGQHLDLEEKKEKSFKEVIQIHELKTSRLIQLSLIGSAMLTENNLTFQRLYTLYRLGRLVGVCFQLKDDLEDYKSERKGHEENINPFYNFNFKEVDSYYENQLAKLSSYKETYPQTINLITSFFKL